MRIISSFPYKIYFINGLFIDGLLFKNTILIVSDTCKRERCPMSRLLRFGTQRSIGVDTVPMKDLFVTVLAELKSLH